VEQVGGQRYVGGERHPDGLAVVERLELDEFLGVLEDEVADPPDEPATVGRGHPAPRPDLERPAGGSDGPVDVFRVALSDVGQGLAGGRVGRLERLP
jgi:hypothetical protein